MTAPQRHNRLGQPIGATVDWQARQLPRHLAMEGHWCRLEPFNLEKHTDDLWRSISLDRDGRLFTYLPYGPFSSFDDYARFLAATCLGSDPRFYAIIEGHSGKATGVAAYLRINPTMGVVEVGHLLFSPLLQRTTAATEAMYLMMRHAFTDCGYRRYEWKCDSLNAPSRLAAERLGFRFEGIFRQATVYKGRNRDHAWYSVLDGEWPTLEQSFERWLEPTNFDRAGQQRSRLHAAV